jgi:polyisoprenoid-binding protein YceI
MTNRVRFVIDPEASRFTVQAFAGGMSGGLGHNPTIKIRDFNGETCFVPETLDAASMTMKIKAASLVVEDEMNLAERRTLERVMNEEVLSTSRHPEVLYGSEDVQAMKLGGGGLYKVELNGKLTLNGITRLQDVISQVTVGPYSLRATGNFQIRQSDFGIVPAKVAGGMLTLRDELKFAFYIVARQASADRLESQPVGARMSSRD